MRVCFSTEVVQTSHLCGTNISNYRFYSALETIWALYSFPRYVHVCLFGLLMLFIRLLMLCVLVRVTQEGCNKTSASNNNTFAVKAENK